ncbi:MAG: hypothetical protein WA432_01685 [Candidatus Babeliaceae bacterium]
MKMKILIPVLAMTFVVLTECALAERLAASNEKILEQRQNINSGKSFDGSDSCPLSDCRDACKSCSGCKKSV